MLSAASTKYWAASINQFPEIIKKGVKNSQIFFNPRRSPPAATHPLYGWSIFSRFLHTLCLPGFKPTTSPSRTNSSNTAPHDHLCLRSILVPHILYKTEHKLIIWGPKLIQMKKLSTTKFYDFLRSTTFILIVSPSEVTYKIWISNLKNSNVVLHDKMISNKKVINYKVS